MQIDGATVNTSSMGQTNLKEDGSVCELQHKTNSQGSILCKEEKTNSLQAYSRDKAEVLELYSSSEFLKG